MEITDSVITSSQTAHTAWQVDDQADKWRVSWLPERTLTRDEAVTAMTLAEKVTDEYVPRGQHDPLVEVFAAELGLSAEDAVSAVEEGS